VCRCSKCSECRRPPAAAARPPSVTRCSGSTRIGSMRRGGIGHQHSAAGAQPCSDACSDDAMDKQCSRAWRRVEEDGSIRNAGSAQPRSVNRLRCAARRQHQLRLQNCVDDGQRSLESSMPLATHRHSAATPRSISANLQPAASAAPPSTHCGATGESSLLSDGAGSYPLRAVQRSP